MPGKARMGTEIVAFLVIDAGAHLQDLADGHAVVAAALQLRHVLLRRIVERGDLVLAEGDADQQRGDRLGHRHRQEPGHRLRAVAVILENHFAMADDEKGVGVGSFGELRIGVALPAEAVRRHREPARHRQVPHRAAARNGAGFEHPVGLAEGEAVHIRIEKLPAHGDDRRRQREAFADEGIGRYPRLSRRSRRDLGVFGATAHYQRGSREKQRRRIFALHQPHLRSAFRCR